jgi:hypothetical protein
MLALPSSLAAAASFDRLNRGVWPVTGAVGGRKWKFHLPFECGLEKGFLVPCSLRCVRIFNAWAEKKVRGVRCLLCGKKVVALEHMGSLQWPPGDGT